MVEEYTDRFMMIHSLFSVYLEINIGDAGSIIGVLCVCGKKESQPTLFSSKDPLNQAGYILNLIIRSPKDL